jgi:PAS domain S-box-containing protein
MAKPVVKTGAAFARKKERKPHEVLRESEVRFRMLADNISQLAWTWDLLGNVTWYNKRWLDYTGLTFEDMKGWDWTKVQHPNHVDRVVARVKRSGETGEPWEDTFPLRGKDGNYRWFLSRALLIRDEQGNLVQWFGTNTDVTEQKLAEDQVARQAQELRALNERLQERDRAKTAFFSNVSHEFRTPLTLMIGPIEEMLAHQAIPSEMRERLEVSHRNSLRLIKLVNSLLDFSRIEAGRIQANYEPTDLSTLTAELASVFRAAIEAAGMKFSVRCEPLAEPVYVDREMWEKIVLNLVSNAFKYTLRGEIEVRLEKSGEWRVASDDRGEFLDDRATLSRTEGVASSHELSGTMLSRDQGVSPGRNNSASRVRFAAQQHRFRRI